MYQLVSYNFDANIHLYRWNELNILLDVNSGAIHVLDNLANDFVTCLMKNRGDFYLAVEECSLH